ncbi:aminomethyl-transferring glycine dehydrogenase [Flavilitoribacter nigricans]|uniref:Glycine dehydrogenase (decarboxylating) n=1 Tax=Flavilitoribacter nigricans (strain ATCC 23147 / DSM 23189 / NBRC 102662 / NCIMB 1420 / SS-2) TaxID=1122177 RepID=A0A2D0N7F6_FLAN2|nr:aminomethyl-transferring glycine dehydrogenase [Flavilitoribacter nigricans]PHN04059.1 glycine dehydrogenase (aminomethyl-transferring) [Flavilitoribacter nigricans DSM 23189 = NBRC 102662]
MSSTVFFDQFAKRHLGVNAEELQEMLAAIGVDSLDQLIDETVPAGIRKKDALDIPEAVTEFEFLKDLKKIAAKNKVFESYIGLGYYNTITPSVILRNIFQNPGWYTQYTPYQAEIAQGRLEALLNFQTMVSDLTGLPIANASLLDEGTAAAEAMTMFYAQKNKRNRGEAINQFLVSDQVFPQTIDILRTRALPLGIEVVVGDWRNFEFNEKTFGILLQYPAADGEVADYRPLVEKAKASEIYVTVAADILSLALLTPPGEWGADAVVGNTQRFGVPMGYGGPHAAYFATKDDFKRQIPGRIIGVSVDSQGNPALRMALQTREQHIRREKATSNICTAQALLAIMAGMYAAYHGPKGIQAIAKRVNAMAQILAGNLDQLGFAVTHQLYFDTLHLQADAAQIAAVREKAEQAEVNFYYTESAIQISLDETTTLASLETIVGIFAEIAGKEQELETNGSESLNLPDSLIRESEFLTHPVFNSYRTESQMMRYIKRLENRDLSLVHSMIPLGSCTMKLNAATELLPVSWPEFANLHPFAPMDQTEGYQQIFRELSAYLSEITGFADCSLQPNSGAQGEYAGLLTIRAYHLSRGDDHRNIALIPSSAHGTNPASAVMAGMEVVVVKCDDDGNIDIEDLRAKAEKHSNELAALMVTYPSTHGVFETGIRDICGIIHQHGGKVYMDGANLNAQVGLTSPGLIDADVCHLNLHKTFAIPHGGGGPGMGPICVNESLQPFLPNHPLVKTGGEQGIHPVSAAPWGSASILLISYAYIRMLGRDGVRKASEYAILNANYIKARLEKSYDVLYVGANGRTAHELIIDLRPFRSLVSAEDVAKRLIDYGFHAPTLSWPVAGTIMIEPTESEDKDELDRFCDAMLGIRKEIDEIASGEADAKQNVLHNAPHTLAVITADEWELPYSRSKAAWPVAYLQEGRKFWPAVGRLDGAYGDRNLVCTCPPLEAYEQEA